MDIAGIAAMVGLAVLVVLAGRVGAVCGRARARAAAGRRVRGAGPGLPARTLVGQAPPSGR